MQSKQVAIGSWYQIFCIKSMIEYVYKNYSKTFMTHLRTKRKPTTENIGRLLFAVIMVFVFMAILISFGNNFRGKKLRISEIGSKLVSIEPISNTAKAVSNEDVWTLVADKILITKDSNEIFIKIADTESTREQGLSGTDQLRVYENDKIVTTEGMLFVFDSEQTMRFWMKDMNYDLDMIWLDKNMKVVDIQNAKASSYDPKNPNAAQIFSNNTPAKYVLEINSGLADKLNLKVGDILKMQ